MRLRRKPGTIEYLMASPLVVNEPEEWQGKWQEYFANNNPLHVELGAGKGKFITTMMKLFKDINYLGVEKVPEVLLKAVKKAERIEVNSLAFLMLDIFNLPQVFSPGEVERFYLNFSDPWPKNRHAKRRLTNPKLLDYYRTILKPGGEIHLKTDNEQFFEYSLNQFALKGWQLQNICLDIAKRGPEFNVTTEYEEKFRAQGMKIFRLEALNS
jgi:tRNA (guanine-N7-)-methyltransferase